MQDKNVPTLNTHYWVTILVASLLGTTFGDFISNDLELGFAGGLLVLSAVIAVIFIAEYKLTWNSVAWYWAAIVATRTAATNLGDFLSRTLKLGNGPVAAILAGLLIAFLFVTRHVPGAAPQLGCRQRTQALAKDQYSLLGCNPDSEYLGHHFGRFHFRRSGLRARDGIAGSGCRASAGLGF